MPSCLPHPSILGTIAVEPVMFPPELVSFSTWEQVDIHSPSVSGTLMRLVTIAEQDTVGTSDGPPSRDLCEHSSAHTHIQTDRHIYN